MSMAEGPWNPGLSSTIPERLMSRVTLYDSKNSTVSWDEARSLSDVTGVKPQAMATFRPERLAMHNVLIRVSGELHVPDGPNYADLGINLRGMAAEIFDGHIEPVLDSIAADYAQLCRKAEVYIASELHSAVLARHHSNSIPRTALLGWLRSSRKPRPMVEQSPDQRALDYVNEHWIDEYPDGDLNLQCRCALARTLSAILSHRGSLLVDKNIIIRIATNLVANAAGSELVGRLVAPFFDQAVAALGYYRLPSQTDPVVLNAKGASAAGKSSIRRQQRLDRHKTGSRLAGLCDHQPRLLAQTSDRLFKPRCGLQIRRHAHWAGTRDHRPKA